MPLRLAVLTAALAAMLSAPAPAAVFAPSDVLSGVLGGGAGPNQNGIVAADFDGDGRTDVAIADPTRGGVRVLRSRGDGTLERGERGPAGFQPYALAPLEIDPTAPGRELAVASLAPSEVRVLARRPAGTWATIQRIPVGAAPFDIAPGDLDGDGRDDTVSLSALGTVDALVQRSGRLARTWRGKSVLSASTISLGVAVADLDGDGDADAISADWLGGPLKSEIRTLLGDGRGGFARGPSRSFTGAAEALRVADVTCDGVPEVVVPVFDGGIVVAGRAGSELLGSLVRKGATFGSNAVDIADLDRDGRPDAVVSNFFGTAQVTLDVCRHGFAVRQRVRTIPASETVLAVDLSGDAYPELLSVGWFATGLAVARNRGATG